MGSFGGTMEVVREMGEMAMAREERELTIGTLEMQLLAKAILSAKAILLLRNMGHGIPYRGEVQLNISGHHHQFREAQGILRSSLATMVTFSSLERDAINTTFVAVSVAAAMFPTYKLYTMIPRNFMLPLWDYRSRRRSLWTI